MNTRNKPVLAEPAALADRLGELRAEIKVLTDQAKGVEALIKQFGLPAIDGDLFRVTVSTFDRDTTNWKGICEKLGASRQIITANTKTAAVTTVRVSAHTKGV